MTSKDEHMTKLSKAPFLHAILPGVLLALLALPASAQQPMGSVVATIDGEVQEWATLMLPEEDTATASYTDFGPVTSITIQGHDLGADSILNNILTVEASLMGRDGAAQPIDMSVSLFPEGLRGPFYTSEETEDETTIGFERLEFGEPGFAVGTFSAKICRRDGMFSEIDLGDCRLIEGRFETQLRFETL
jgi:hypothetical protein